MFVWSLAGLAHAAQRAPPAWASTALPLLQHCRYHSGGITHGAVVKVRPSVKPICEHCKVIRRHGRVMVICTNNARHKQRQG